MRPVQKHPAHLEKLLRLRITVIDRDGLFNYKQKNAVFIRTRRSHQTMDVCRIGFCDRCRANCRYALNQLCLDEPAPHYSVCWKGVGQIAIPLRHRKFHYGVLYAGCFRDPAVRPPENLPEEFYPAFQELPEVGRERLDEAVPTLHIFAHGLITYLREENILNDNYDFRVRKLHDFLEENCVRQIGLAEVAHVLRLSESYASSFIREQTGHNFSVLLRSIRIDRAKKLLMTTDETLYTVARRCGFSNEFHFSRVFKAATGISPSRFRLLH